MDLRVVHPVPLPVRDVVAEFHVLDDLRHSQHPGSCQPGELVSAGEQRNSATGGQRALELNRAANVARVALTAGLLDFGSDRVQLLRELLDVLGGQVSVFLDIGDSH